ncbi:MAG: hypothetical protein CL912_04420 [Deltaproteobacteria bacterium]|nr:hypothetical protein [Deltaproteobacteria bacterium]
MSDASTVSLIQSKSDIWCEHHKGQRPPPFLSVDDEANTGGQSGKHPPISAVSTLAEFNVCLFRTMP